ncbi:hypothetical protein FSOLCH5_002163 [Fusarium solani]|jgi:hypothetical protein
MDNSDQETTDQKYGSQLLVVQDDGTCIEFDINASVWQDPLATTDAAPEATA